jgi:hypothetical protein
MPLLFFIDKDVLDDPTCQHVDDVVLSYTFFRSVVLPPRPLRRRLLISLLLAEHAGMHTAHWSRTRRRMLCKSRWALTSTSTRRRRRIAWYNARVLSTIYLQLLSVSPLTRRFVSCLPACPMWML